MHMNLLIIVIDRCKYNIFKCYWKSQVIFSEVLKERKMKLSFYWPLYLPEK